MTRCLRANRQAFDLIERLPLTQRLLLEVHRTLLTGVRGEERSPGQLRRSPVWIGPRGATPETAHFVPPPADLVPALLSDWEDYVNNAASDPVLVRAALMHYQFETIHPFLDGNGRIGRLAVSLVLKESGRLSYPLLYVSGYLEAHRDEYYARLQAVRERGEVQAWLRYFLTDVRLQADDGVRRARSLIELRESYLHQAVRSRSTLPRLVELLFRNPFVTVARVRPATDLTDQGARNLIRAAEGLGWVRSLGTRGRGGREYWVAPEVLSIIEGPPENAGP